MAILSSTTKKLFMRVTRYWCQTLTKCLFFFRMIFIEVLSMKYHEHSSMRVALIYATRRTDMTELIGASHGFANASRNSCGPHTFEFLNLWSAAGKTWTPLGESTRNIPTFPLQATES